MATYSVVCGSVGGFSYAGRFTLYVELTNRNGDPATNQSIVDYNVYFQNTSGGGTFTAKTRLYFRLNGVVIRDETISVTGPRNGSVGIASGSMTVGHNSDGSQAVSFQALVQGSSYGISGNIENTFTLNTIPRASSITCSSTNVGSNPTISIKSASSSFTHTVTYVFGSLSGTVATGLGGGNYTGWTIPDSFYAQIPNSPSGRGTLYCNTYSGGTHIGQSTCDLNVTTDPNICKPDVTGSIKDTNPETIELTGDENKLIRYFSTAYIKVSAQAKNSASIKRVTVNGLSISNNEVWFTDIENNEFEIIATDSREYFNQVVLTADMIPYAPLSLNATFYRPSPTTGEVSVRYSGNYYNGSFGTTENTLEIKWYYREKIDFGDPPEWIEGGILIPEKIEENKIVEETISLGTHYEYRKEYEFQIIATDKLTSITRTASVSMGLPVFNWGKDFFNVNVTGIFRDHVRFEGDLRIKGDVNAEVLGKAMTVDLVDSFNEVNLSEGLFRSGLYTVKEKSTDIWYNLLNLRHRNGATDGVNYGWQIRRPFNPQGSIQSRVQQAGTWTNWEELLRSYGLYDNAGGTDGGFYLSESAGNFLFIEVFYITNDGVFGSTRIYAPNNKSLNLLGIQPRAGDSAFLKSKVLTINDTYVSVLNYSEVGMAQGVITYGAYNNIRIYKVVGYR